MSRLGYTCYVAQGGDVGAAVTDAMARQAPTGLIAVHFNFLINFLPDVMAAIFGGGVCPQEYRRRSRRPSAAQAPRSGEATSRSRASIRRRSATP
jgi:hypothetical protein